MSTTRHAAALAGGATVVAYFSGAHESLIVGEQTFVCNHEGLGSPVEQTATILFEIVDTAAASAYKPTDAGGVAVQVPSGSPGGRGGY